MVPGATRKESSFKHRIAAVAEGHAVELDLAARVREGDGAGALDDLHRDVSNSSQTRESETPPETRLVYRPIRFCTGASRRMWYAIKATSEPVVSLAIDHQLSAVEEDGRGGSGEHRAGDRAGQKRRQLHAHEGVQKALVAGAEAFHLARLGVGRDHQPHAQQGLEQEAADIGAALAHRCGRGRPGAAGSAAAPKDSRGRRRC